jgi:hypothetical protein
MNQAEGALTLCAKRAVVLDVDCVTHIGRISDIFLALTQVCSTNWVAQRLGVAHRIHPRNIERDERSIYV